MNRINNLTKLLQVNALIVKFVIKLKKSVRNANKPVKEVSPNTLDLKEAKTLWIIACDQRACSQAMWIRAVQAASFAEELEFLRGENSAKPTAYVRQFGLFLKEGVIKCKGRVNNSTLSNNSRNPVLLPAKHAFVRLIIKDVHDSLMQSGIRGTLTTIRERYWILRGREAV